MNGTNEPDLHDHSPWWAYLAFGEDAGILGKRFPQDPVQADVLIRRGLPPQAAEGLVALPCLQHEPVFQALFGITQRTYRDHLNIGLPLSPRTSDMIWRFAMIFGRLQAALGGRDEAQAWLCRPMARLSGKPPLALLPTGPGQAAVSACLCDLEARRDSQLRDFSQD